jgi:glycerol-3-phosphate acyltransferase PlsY
MEPHPRLPFILAAIKFLLPPVLGGYLLGAIPFGLILTKLAGQGDIRQMGSGNIGATNVLRTGNKGLAALTLLLDSGKGAIAVLLAIALYPAWLSWFEGRSAPTVHATDVLIWSCVAGFSAVLGHIFPVWLGFRGGKGVATALGVFFALAWPVGLACAATWLAVAALFRFSSLAALVAMILAPLYACLWAPPLVPSFTLAIAVLVIAKHHGNIRRLLKGEEPRIGKSG